MEERKHKNNKGIGEKGMRKSGWMKGIVLLVLAGGLLTAGFFVNHYLFAQAAAGEAIKPSKDGELHVAKAAGSLKLAVKSAQLEKEWMQNQQQKAVADYKQKLDKEIAKVQDKPPVKVVTKPVVTKPAPPKNPPAKQPQANPQPPAQPANSGKRTIYLTFDDGPEIFSNQIIDLLEKYHFKATFFMLDPNIKKYPEMVKLMVQKGDAIGSHGVTHNKNLFYKSPASALGEMNQTRNTLKSITGVDSYLIRTPYGSVPYLTPDERKTLFDNHYLMWDWNIDSRDWDYKDDRYVTSVINQLNAHAHYQGPIVILMHERRETLAHLPRLFDYLAKQGYECKAIDNSVAPYNFKPR